jgi:hypothetical protein
MSRPAWDGTRPSIAASSMGFTSDRKGKDWKDTQTHFVQRKSENWYFARDKKTLRTGYGRTAKEAIEKTA